MGNLQPKNTSVLTARGAKGAKGKAQIRGLAERAKGDLREIEKALLWREIRQDPVLRIPEVQL